MARTTLPQLKKYDVSQRIIEALADTESRALLFTAINEEKSAAELSEINRIPLSSVYKKLAITGGFGPDGGHPYCHGLQP